MNPRSLQMSGERKLWMTRRKYHVLNLEPNTMFFCFISIFNRPCFILHNLPVAHVYVWHRYWKVSSHLFIAIKYKPGSLEFSMEQRTTPNPTSLHSGMTRSLALPQFLSASVSSLIFALCLGLSIYQGCYFFTNLYLLLSSWLIYPTMVGNSHSSSLVILNGRLYPREREY